ncbi:MAG: HlyC/CorC family transporter [Lachnospiraceae bacterium]|nr:HlyC/CorC family transporter [Lachnospiraceae bacterium]
MDTPGAIQLAVLAVLLVLSAFFSSAETALTTISIVKVRAMVEENPKGRVLTLQKILNSKSKLISAVLIGNNIVNMSASSLMTALVIRIWGNAAVGIGTGALTMFVLVFGEIVPKTWAMCNNEKLSLAYANIIYFLMNILTPVIFIVDKIAGFFLRLLHIDPSSRAAMTETELKTYVDVSHEDGVIEQEEKKLIYNVFEFGDSIAKDIMIPRISMTTVDVNASYDELLAIFSESMYTRIPVYEDEIDNIIGFVNVKDFLLVTDKSVFQIRDIMREGYYTYEYKKTADLLLEMRHITSNVALVLNEYGATVGMITIEDLLEEIVGEIRDEYDEDEAELLKQLDDFQYEVGGSMKLNDINDALNTTFESEDYDSIGGIMIELLDRFPTEGEEVITENGISLTATKVDNNRIETVVILLPPPVEEESEEGTDEVNESNDTQDTTTGQSH